MGVKSLTQLIKKERIAHLIYVKSAENRYKQIIDELPEKTWNPTFARVEQCILSQPRQPQHNIRSLLCFHIFKTNIDTNIDVIE
jgi:hypothetical protein